MKWKCVILTSEKIGLHLRPIHDGVILNPEISSHLLTIEEDNNRISVQMAYAPT